MPVVFQLLTVMALAIIARLLEQSEASKASDQHYVVVGVSGGLQDGFPDHAKMDYHQGEDDTVKAIFVGRGLVRGAKAFLDVMESGYRQYVPQNSSAQPLINSVVMVSGCHEHANQYWLYAVDSRQFITILNNEPRFLSITPDTGLVDLTADQTDETVKILAQHEIDRQNKTDSSRVAFPIVVAVWYHDSFVPSPEIQEKSGNGTMVTNFPESLARWAGVDDADRTAGWCSEAAGRETCPARDAVMASNRRYWEGIRRAIRHSEDTPLSRSDWRSNGPPFHCDQRTRLGVGSETARINYPFSTRDLVSIFSPERGYEIDFTSARIRSM